MDWIVSQINSRWLQGFMPFTPDADADTDVDVEGHEDDKSWCQKMIFRTKIWTKKVENKRGRRGEGNWRGIERKKQQR